MGPLSILALVFIGITVGGYLVRTYSRRKRAAVMESLRLEPDHENRPRILSFYGPSCDACDRQKIVLQDLQRAHPKDFSLELRDATVDYDYAQQFGLMVVPTTVVIAGSGAITAINSGFTPQATLEEQLEAA